MNLPNKLAHIYVDLLTRQAKVESIDRRANRDISILARVKGELREYYYSNVTNVWHWFYCPEDEF